MFLAIVSAQQWPLHQVGINDAYLHGFVEEELYMTPPAGYAKAQYGQVCRLIKSIYGLKQVGH